MAMFKEATNFAGHLKQLEKDLKALQKQIDVHSTSLRNILVSPLPRVYEEGLQGPVPSEDEPRMIGGNVQVERISGASQELKKRLEQEVIQPLKAWLDAYRTVEVRIKELEALRLELDSRRRTVGSLQGRLERVKTLPATNNKRDIKIKDTEEKKEHKEEKMQRTQEQYKHMEQIVYNSLFTLIKDTSVLRDYAAAALLIVQECFQTAYSSFEPATAEYSAATTGYGMENRFEAPTIPAEQVPSASRQNQKMRKEEPYVPTADSEAVDQAYPVYSNGYAGAPVTQVYSNPYPPRGVPAWPGQPTAAHAF